MKTGFFEESPGIKSSNRLIFVIGSMWNMLLCSYLAYRSIDPLVILSTYSGIQAVLIGLKLGQKAMESKPEQQ